ncbi:MAG: DUF3015 family protein [Pirellulaceae bacterium]
MNRLIAIGAVSALLVVPQALMAQDNEIEPWPGNSQLNPWQHCGIGAQVFDDNTTASALSNVIWDSGSTAVTSATISPEMCNSKDIQVAEFIDSTYDTLAVETAAGAGEHLNALLTLQGVEGSDRSTVISRLREDLHARTSEEHYAQLSHSDRAFQMYQSLNNASGT